MDWSAFFTSILSSPAATFFGGAAIAGLIGQIFQGRQAFLAKRSTTRENALNRTHQAQLALDARSHEAKMDAFAEAVQLLTRARDQLDGYLARTPEIVGREATRALQSRLRLLDPSVADVFEESLQQLATAYEAEQRADNRQATYEKGDEMLRESGAAQGVREAAKAEFHLRYGRAIAELQDARASAGRSYRRFQIEAAESLRGDDQR